MKRILFSVFVLTFVFSLNSNAAVKNKTQIRTDTAYSREIVVTALRYPEKLIEVPMAISIITKSELGGLRGFGMDEVLNRVPGVLAQSRSGNQDVRFTIRGFGTRGAGDRSNSGTSRGIKFYIDGVPETEPDGRTSFDNFDLSLASNVEIIRSNSSALWGNSAGGVVNISNEPLFSGKGFANVDLVGGSWNYKKTALTAGVKMNSTDKLYASFSGTKFDGWRQNSESERYLAMVGYRSVGESTQFGMNLSAVNNRFFVPGPLTLSDFENSPENANATYLARQERRHNRIGKISAMLNHQFSDATELYANAFVSTKFLQRSERNTFRDFTRYNVGGSMNAHTSFGLGSSAKNTVLAGFDESYQDGAILFYYLSPTAGRGDLKTDKREGANTFGVFAQNETVLWLGDGEEKEEKSLSLILGGRYDNVTYYSEVYFDGGANKRMSEDKSYTHFTPKAGLTYRFARNYSLYLNVGGGVEVPAGNETDPVTTFSEDTVHLVNSLLEPIVSTTFELGNKGRMDFKGFVKRFDWDVAAYYISTKNELVPYSGGTFYLSAGKTVRMGLEFGASAAFDYGVSFNAAITASSNKYDEYKVDSVHYGQANSSADYKDNKIAGIPDIYYNFSIRWTPAFFNYVFAEVNAQGVGKYFADDANKYEVPEYTVFNITLGTAKEIFVSDNVYLKLFASANNITDKKYASSAFVNPDLDKKTKLPLYLEPGLPRNFAVGISIGWK